MDIAIAIPAYNNPRYCEMCLKSLVGQQSQRFPIYIFDDASVEDYLTIVQSFYTLRIHYFKNSKNLGALQNMQSAYNQVKLDHKYLMVMHEDDLLSPHFFKVVIDELESEKNQPKLVLSYFTEFVSNNLVGFEKFAKEQPKLKWLTKRELVKAFLKLQPIAFGSAIYNTTAYANMKLDLIKYEEFADRPFLLSALTDDDQVLVVESPLYYYRSHHTSDNRWRNLKPENVFSLLSLYRTILNPINSNDWKEYRKMATHFIFEAYKNLKHTGKEPLYLYYLSQAFQKGFLSPKYALLKVSFINRFFTSIKSFLFG